MAEWKLWKGASPRASKAVRKIAWRNDDENKEIEGKKKLPWEEGFRVRINDGTVDSESRNIQSLKYKFDKEMQKNVEEDGYNQGK